MADGRTATQAERRLGARGRRRRDAHLHAFRWLVDDDLHGSLYGCRCGEVRPGL